MAAAVVARRDHEPMVARVVAMSKPLVHRVHGVRKVKAGKGRDVAGHQLVTYSLAATKADLPVGQWASRVLRARHPVDSLTPCVPASI